MMARLGLERLPAYGLFGGVLAAAGLPIYIYAPPFYAENYGVSLTGIAGVLFWLRMVDAVQDPFFGWLCERLGRWRRSAVTAVAGVLAMSMIGLFSIAPPFHPLIWFTVTITGLFSAYSFLTINFYAQGVSKGEAVRGGHIRVAAWRETGALLGVCLAAILPTAFLTLTTNPEGAFAYFFAAFVGIAAIAIRPEWQGRARRGSAPARPPPATTPPATTPIRTIIKDVIARRLLILGFFNAIPVAVSSTLFLFYVGAVLGADGWEGALLVVFFLCAAASAPLWSALALRLGEKRVLMGSMALAVVSFAFTLGLGEGDIVWFALVCVVTGATVGADLTLMPALFSARMSVINPSGGQGFGLWSFVAKFSLSFAAITMLPLLDSGGFSASEVDNSPEVLSLLTYLYALVPCVFKVVAFAILAITRLESAPTVGR